ncbi:MFS transporter [Paenibacillus darwinianus]|uniref:MFS transporter n=1 Tax=Paenibacillus darwinianus TaxID=1380763 RepID=A0A9W5S0P9_9BACL|nr:MFS transporter [Paenibacillus darwinianus]EXX88877.1 MFS transporter [Paenibacillus darwinianus]EXX89117.1 MFS transporter [Paenibacillus darwinianus]EXX90448.1 MFS transporter [Paenibacillus darwinianus]
MDFKLNRSFGREIVLFSVILLFVEFVRGAFVISFLPIYGGKTLGLSLDVIGVAITAHYLTDTALKIMIGWLLDRISARTIVHLGLLVSLLGVFLIAYADVPWLFITASALYGVGMSPIWIVCLTKVTEANRATQMGYLYTIWFIGMGAGPIVCNLLLDTSPVFTYRLLVGLSLFAWLLSLFISNRRERDVDTIPLREQFAILKSKLRQMRLLLPGMILQTMGAGMLVPILPSFAEKQLGINPSQYSLILMAGGLFTIAGLMPMGRLSDRIGGKKWFLIGGFGMFAVGLGLLAMHPSLWEAVMLAALLGISYAALLPAWNALLASYVPPQQQGLGWGIFSTVEGIGVMIGPIVGGVIGTFYSQTDVVRLSAVLFGLIALLYLLFPFRPVSDD